MVNCDQCKKKIPDGTKYFAITHNIERSDKNGVTILDSRVVTTKCIDCHTKTVS